MSRNKPITVGTVQQMRCPSCGNEETFLMEVPVVLEVAPRGDRLKATLDTENPELLWDGELWVRCTRCGDAASDRDFIETYEDHLAEQEEGA